MGTSYRKWRVPRDTRKCEIHIKNIKVIWSKEVSESSGILLKKIVKIHRKYIEILVNMSSTSSTIDDSQDDSDINFVAGYALEVQDEDNPNRNPNMPFITEEKEDCAQPYDGEPIADENWISHYNEQKIVQDEHLQVLQSRLDKPETVDMW